ARDDKTLDAVQATPDRSLWDREAAAAVVSAHERVLLLIEAGEVAVVEPLRLHELELAVEGRADEDEQHGTVGAVRGQDHGAEGGGGAVVGRGGGGGGP